MVGNLTTVATMQRYGELRAHLWPCRSHHECEGQRQHEPAAQRQAKRKGEPKPAQLDFGDRRAADLTQHRGRRIGARDLRDLAKPLLECRQLEDVNELLAGANMRNFAVAWLGGMSNREQIAKRVSPLTYVRAGLPPIISIQGDADPTVPYSQNVRLHQALDKAGISNELVTIPGGKHGGFSDAEMTKAYAAIRAFLDKQNIVRQTTN